MLAAFDAAHITPVETNNPRKFFLAPTALIPKPTHARTKEGLYFRPIHVGVLGM